jgi:hypothetical protein
MKISSLILVALTLFCLSTQAHEIFSPGWISEQAADVILRDVRVDSRTPIQVRFQTSQSLADGSELVVVLLSTESIPEFPLYLRGPKGFAQSKSAGLSGLFVVGGFFTGADSTALLGAIPQTVTVGFNYPYDLTDMKQDAGKLLQTFRLTAPQVALGLKWISVQGWLKKERFVVLGVSMGGLFLPTALRLAQRLEVNVTHTVLAFTGSNLPLILENNLHAHVSEQLLNPLKFFISTTNVLNNPQWHLPFLQGRFLVISADQDQIIPTASTDELFALLPEKKARVILAGGHINVDQPALIEQTRNAVLKWLQVSP